LTSSTTTATGVKNTYFSPEWVKEELCDKTCDWWSAGIILFEMLFGVSPFERNTEELTRKRIIHWKFNFEIPEKSTQDSSELLLFNDLISKLICDPSDRLGRQLIQTNLTPIERIFGEGDAKEIKEHPWFNGFGWDTILSSTPPFVPPNGENSNTDTEEAEISPVLIEFGDFNIDIATPPSQEDVFTPVPVSPCKPEMQEFKK
jgi:serine/threonine protein kinase